MLKDNVQDNFYDILILDDEPFILDIFSHFLADRGFNVQVTSSASQAITYLTDSKFDLVMLDVNLKYGNFSDILSEVKETIYSDIPIILTITEINNKPTMPGNIFDNPYKDVSLIKE